MGAAARPKGPALDFVEGRFRDPQPASFFIKFAAGADSGGLTHSEEYSTVMLRGRFTQQQAVQPATVVHRNGCLAGDDCLVYVHFDHGADSTVTTREGKTVPMSK